MAVYPQATSPLPTYLKLYKRLCINFALSSRKWLTQAVFFVISLIRFSKMKLILVKKFYFSFSKEVLFFT